MRGSFFPCKVRWLIGQLGHHKLDPAKLQIIYHLIAIVSSAHPAGCMPTVLRRTMSPYLLAVIIALADISVHKQFDFSLSSPLAWLMFVSAAVGRMETDPCKHPSGPPES